MKRQLAINISCMVILQNAPTALTMSEKEQKKTKAYGKHGNKAEETEQKPQENWELPESVCGKLCINCPDKIKIHNI